MLTNGDLANIGKVVDEKIEKRLEKFGDVVDEKIKKQLKPVKDDIAQIRKDIKVMIGFLDNEYLDLRKRVERIEAHLKISVS